MTKDKYRQSKELLEKIEELEKRLQKCRVLSASDKIRLHTEIDSTATIEITGDLIIAVIDLIVEQTEKEKSKLSVEFNEL